MDSPRRVARYGGGVMTARAEKEALEAAGFVRLPTLWVYPEEAAAIYQIAKKHRARVHEIKKQARRGK